MSSVPLVLQPPYIITPAMARRLMEIEAARAVVEQSPLPPTIEAELRQRVRIRATHYSTRIECNLLTLEEAAHIIAQEGATVRGRERDVREVRNYWNALLRVEEWAAQEKPLSEDLIRRLHALVEYDQRASPTPYRDGQNVIRDSASGGIVYMPPEAADVPALMTGLVNWVNLAGQENLPVPIVAGLAHYQFVAIHPFYDGNGRTARLLATFLLHRGGYGLHGFFSLEEYHARDLEAYYKALAVHPHHNYYEGHAEADLTPWLDYFLGLLSDVFTAARDEALHLMQNPVAPEPDFIRKLDQRARLVLGLFSRQDEITTSQIAAALGLSPRMARLLCQGWLQDGWLEMIDPSRRKRAYRLSEEYRQYIGKLSAMPGSR
jgi:Fic family protein